jgi:hypothetical protein
MGRSRYFGALQGDYQPHQPLFPRRLSQPGQGIDVHVGLVVRMINYHKDTSVVLPAYALLPAARRPSIRMNCCLDGVEVSYGGLFGAAALTSIVGYRSSGCVRLIERLLDRRRDPAPIADVVAVLAGPLPHSSSLLAGLPTALSPGATGAATVAASAGLDLPGAFDESADGRLELCDILSG